MQIKDRRQTSVGEFFTVELDNGIEIKDCKVVDGSKGRFVSGPSRKYEDKDGNTKYASLVYFGDVASKQVLSLYDGDAGGFDPDDSDLPF